MSELVDRVITGLAALGGSAAFLEILRRWLQRWQEKRQEQLQLDVRILEEGHALRQEAYQRERRHKAELLALEAQLQAKLEALTRANEALTRDLDRVNANSPRGKLNLLAWARRIHWSMPRSRRTAPFRRKIVFYPSL
jgi:hypothetical protein